MTRPALTDEQRDVLTGRRAPPSDASGDWSIRDCHIAAEQWSQVEFEGMLMEDVDIDGLSWSAPIFRRCVFRRVSFERAAFRKAVFEDVRFEDCQFEEVSWIAVKLLRCHWTKALVVESRMLRSRMVANQFAGVTVRGWDIEETDLSLCTWQASTLANVRFEASQLKEMSYQLGELVEVTCNYSDVENGVLKGVKLDGLTVIGGNMTRLTLDEVSGTDLMLSDVDVDTLALSGCRGLDFLRVSESRVKRIEMVNCVALEAVSIHDCELATLWLENSSFNELNISEVRSVGPSVIQRCTVSGWKWDGGGWADLAVYDTALSESFEVAGTTFSRMSLQRVSHAPKLFLAIEGVTYNDCPRTWDEPHGD